MKKISENSILLCGRPQACCPVLTLDKKNKNIKIKDDFGGEIQITLNQARMIERALNKLDK